MYTPIKVVLHKTTSERVCGADSSSDTHYTEEEKHEGPEVVLGTPPGPLLGGRSDYTRGLLRSVIDTTEATRVAMVGTCIFCANLVVADLNGGEERDLIKDAGKYSTMNGLQECGTETASTRKFQGGTTNVTDQN